MATFSQSNVARGSDSFSDFFCSPCLEHSVDQWAEFYCINCQKCYCAKCINLHGQLFEKHVTYGRGDTSKWPVSKEVENFLWNCDHHGDEHLKVFCNDHSQLCCTNCAFLNHRQCAKVTLLSELIKGPPPDWQQLSRKIQIILETLTKLENIGNTNMQSSQLSYNNQLDEIRQTRQKINTILDKIEKNTIKELDDKMTTLKASIQTDLDNCIKLKNELKQLSDAIHAIVDKGQAELSFIATKKCLEKIKLSKTFLKKNAVQAERSLTFQADTDITQFFSKRLGLGRILFNYPDKVFTVQRKSEYDVRIPSDSKSCDITANCVLSSDQILVTDDKNQCVKLLDLQYQVVGHCDLNAHPSDMCQITPSQVAVTMYKKKTHEVQFVSVNGGQLVKGRKLQFQHNVLGIANSQKDLYITDGTALYKYSMSGGLLGTVYLDLSGELTVWKCAVSQIGDKIYVINCSHHKVITLARDGYRVLCTFTDPDLQLPSFIHVTAQGQVLVCGASSHTLLQLNGEGRKNLATLVTSRDGLNIPKSVCYNRSTDSIIVGQHNNIILVFKVQ